MTIKARLTIYLLLIGLIFVKPAEAYLDPSTGSYLFQFLIAGLLGGTFFLRGTLQNFVNKLIGKKTKTPLDDREDDKQK